MKRCPFCAEDIQDAAIVCKHCGRDVGPKPAAAPFASAAASASSKSIGVAAVASLVIPGADQMYCERLGRGFGFLFATVFAYLIFPLAGLAVYVAAVLDAARCAGAAIR